MSQTAEMPKAENVAVNLRKTSNGSLDAIPQLAYLEGTHRVVTIRNIAVAPSNRFGIRFRTTQTISNQVGSDDSDVVEQRSAASPISEYPPIAIQEVNPDILNQILAAVYRSTAANNAANNGS
jgi:hypothetical protein